jgi:HTH-type transcriptional regulator/antitoxin HigA
MLAKTALTSSFLDFASQASNILHIQSEQDYEEALEFIEYLFEQAEDEPDEPLHDLIDIVSRAIEQYELKQDDIILFDQEAKDINQSISAIRVLMEQHHLTATDLQDEIGSKSLVSMILNGKRNLTIEHITKLSQRFNVSPAIFIDLRVVS